MTGRDSAPLLIQNSGVHVSGAALTDSRAVLNLEQDLLKGLTVQTAAPVAA